MGDHTITVCAFNDIGETCVPTLAFRAGAPPSPPTNFRFVIVGVVDAGGVMQLRLERVEYAPPVEPAPAVLRIPRQ